MDINISEGLSEITYPDAPSVSLVNYNEYLKGVVRFESDGSFKIYIPNSPFSEFTTLDANRQYKFDALTNFVIHTD
ncbi:hypothetical protein EBU71_16885 [bacterium]|nr:hypothetical protein [Candidatus Elulimicrobium humile]